MLRPLRQWCKSRSKLGYKSGNKEAAILAVERLRPNGSQVVADAIEQQLKTSIEKGDHHLIARDAPWKRARYRLLARLG